MTLPATTRRPHRRRSLLSLGTGVVAALVLSSCAGAAGDTEAEPVPTNSISVGEVPDYYPADYAALIEAAEAEGGELEIYSNTDQENWAPVFRDFKKKYPWVTNISANNLGSDEVFQRELSEQATGNAPADLLVSNATQAWADFAEREGSLLEYTSPEIDKLPDFAQVLPNVVAMSADPQTIAYNTSLLPDAPTGLASLADQVDANPQQFTNMLGVRDITGAFGYTMFHYLTEAKPEAWDSLAKILPLTRPETSSGTLTEKTLSGEYVASILVTAAPAFPTVRDSNGLFEIVLPDDGTVVIPRGLGIAATAPHPATAKLFTDFVLSEEGQQAILEGGLASYREGTESVPDAYSYQDVVDEVGEDQIILAPYETADESTVAEFTDKWNSYLK
jgi:iron(III) transport system substrate-binding protein